MDVSLPLFGVLSADPSSHDIDQISIVKGGAKAIDFNRSGGFSVNSISKSGTNTWKGEVSYQVQTDSMTGDRDTGSNSEFEQDRDWALFSIGGPIATDSLFFYGSYYRPNRTRDNQANLYGPVPDFESERDEFFGKLSFQPTDSLFLHGSYRDSDSQVSTASVGAAAAASTSEGSESTLGITIFEGNWVITPQSYANFKFTDFENETSSRPDNLFGFQIAADGSVGLDVNALDTQGLFQVPTLRDGEAAYNAFVGPLIERYGFVRNGREGGGEVGGWNHDQRPGLLPRELSGWL